MGEEVSNNAIEVYVHRLRKKIEPSGVRIITVRGLGYCLEKPAAPVPGPGPSAHAETAAGAPMATALPRANGTAAKPSPK